jgi:hypothetical protein
VEGNLQVQNVSRRNVNFKVISRDSPSYLIKMPRDHAGLATIAHEAKVYQFFLSNSKDFARYYLPSFYEYDSVKGLLILEFLDDSQDLRIFYSQGGRFPIVIGTQMGELLGALHREIPSQKKIFEADPRYFARLPGSFLLHRPRLEIFHEVSAANLQMIKILQRFGTFGELVDRLLQEWMPTAFIHCDIKCDNFLVCRTSLRKNDLKIVDWEAAGFGDPCWDIGSIFCDYLFFWVQSMPVTGDSPPEQFMTVASYPLNKMQPAIRSFWQSYVTSTDLDPLNAGEYLIRSVRYGAVRLLQSAYEQMQYSTLLTGNIICLLQLSFNILERPQEAIVHLLGIPLK